MSTETKVRCDMCGILKPKQYSEYKGWASVYISGEEGSGSRDFCPACWSPIERVLRREFVDRIMEGVT